MQRYTTQTQRLTEVFSTCFATLGRNKQQGDSQKHTSQTDWEMDNFSGTAVGKLRPHLPQSTDTLITKLRPGRKLNLGLWGALCGLQSTKEGEQNRNNLLRSWNWSALNSMTHMAPWTKIRQDMTRDVQTVQGTKKLKSESPPLQPLTVCSISFSHVYLLMSTLHPP